MKETMRERIARAIRLDDGSPCISVTRKQCVNLDGCVCHSLAEAALAAMNPATPEMHRAGEQAIVAGSGANYVFAAMLTAAAK